MRAGGKIGENFLLVKISTYYMVPLLIVITLL